MYFDEEERCASVMKKVRSAFQVSKQKQAETQWQTEHKAAVKPERKLALSSILSVEHAVNNLQSSLRTILSTAWDEQELAWFKSNKESIESNDVLLALERSKVTLAAMIKSLYAQGQLNILDQIVNFEQIQVPLSTNNKAVSLDIGDESFANDGYHEGSEDDDENVDRLPPLPPIEIASIRARVFTHKSLVKDKLFISEKEVIHTHNERLEFIGDSILNGIMSQIAYNAFPNATEGELSQLRSKLISNATLQKWAIAYGFDKSLKMNTDASIHKGKLKIYADVFEAYIGGLIVESPSNYSKVYKWLRALAFPIINSGITIEERRTKELNMNAKSELYSLIGYAGLGLQYHTVLREIQNGTSWFKVQLRTKDNDLLGTGSAKNTKEAGIRAAMAALDNKELVEKYSLMRAAIPKSESKISLRDEPLAMPAVKQEDLQDSRFAEPQLSNAEPVPEPVTLTPAVAVASASTSMAPEVFHIKKSKGDGLPRPASTGTVTKEVAYDDDLVPHPSYERDSSIKRDPRRATIPQNPPARRTQSYNGHSDTKRGASSYSSRRRSRGGSGRGRDSGPKYSDRF